MTFTGLLKRDLLFYRRSNIGMLLLAAVCSAVLTGALLVGDSVQSSLRRLSRLRLGKTQYALSAGERFFRQELAEAVAQKANAPAVPVLHLRGILESADGSVHVSHINIYGVGETFWQLALTDPQLPEDWPADGAVLLNEAVRTRLGETPDNLLLRTETVSLLSNDLIFALESAQTQAWPVSVAGTVADDAIGRFSLQSQQDVPLNVFVPIDWLAERTDHAGQANLLLIPQTPSGEATAADYQAWFKQSAALTDYGLNLRSVENRNVIELSTPRIFLEDPVGEAAMGVGNGAYGVFTYFVNEIRAGQRSVPYSMVTAFSENGPVPPPGPGEIAVNEWLANALSIGQGDALRLTFYQLTSTRELVEAEAEFTVSRVVPMMGPFADSTLMPAYPGIAEAENCRDWDPGIPIDLDKIQPRDEAYWDRYGGAPKAFVSLETARQLWSNRYGDLTAVRCPAGENTESDLRAALLERIDPSAIGLVFRDVQAVARQSAAGSTDFSGLFGGLSMFLIFSAAILLALVFIFYVETRLSQVGLLLAVGWNWLKIFGLFIAEGAVLALSGCVLGALASVVYARVLILVLNATFWSRALADLQLVFDASFGSLVLGACVSFLICLLAIQAALYHRIRRPVHQLLTGTVDAVKPVRRPRSQLSLWLGLVCLAAAMLLPWQSAMQQSQTTSFFLTGILLLMAVVFLSAFALKWLRTGSRSFARSQTLLAVRNIPRRMGRSLTVLITMACGVFVVIGVGANYKGIGDEVRRRDAGTGGFTLIAQTTIPMQDLPTLPLDAQLAVPPIPPPAVVPFRLYQRDDASCLNLNQAQQPTLLGIQPRELAARDAFDFQKSIDDEADTSPWLLLEQDLGEGVIPAIGDYPTLIWGLKKNLGDKITYTAENGQTVKLQIVAVLDNSILQGKLVIAEADFVRYFPSVDGYQYFLVDADWDEYAAQSAQLARQYRDFGMDIVPTADQLARFQEVENTYLAIFLVLGGLGLILGSAGLGLVLVINVLDRKGELAMMQAIGFRQPELTYILFLEHGLLLTAGIVGGLIPALLAVLPVIRTQGDHFPYGIVTCAVLAMLLSGAVWVRIAIGRVLKMNFLETLRNQ